MSLAIDEICQSSCYRRKTCHAAPARSDHTGVGALCATVCAPGLAPCPTVAPGRHAVPGPRTIITILRAMGLAMECRFPNDHWVLNRAIWPVRQANQILLGLLITLLVPSGATIVLWADDTVERRSGRKIKAKGCFCDAVRSAKNHVICGFGFKWALT